VNYQLLVKEGGLVGRQFKVLPMDESHIEAVSQIEVEVAPLGWNGGIFKNCLKVGYPSWVVIHHGDIIGYGMISVAAQEAHLLNIAIAPSYQQQGVGRQLLQFLLKQAKQSGAETIFLEVRPSNIAAVALYMKDGYEHIGVRKGYYADQVGREDGWVFSKNLLSHHQVD
jgi:[ribosomal protein S18]-alanine N-acetyltransferase